MAINRPRRRAPAEPETTSETGDDAALPLSPDEDARAEQIGLGLRSELMAILDALPSHARGARALARFLSLDRNTAHRILAALERHTDVVELLADLPGTQGLSQFLEAVGDHAELAMPTGPAEAALAEFEQFIKRVAGSQAQLARRIRARSGGSTPARSSAETLAARRRLFDQAVAVVGRSNDVTMSISILRPMPDDPQVIEQVTVMGQLGVRCLAHGMPIVHCFGSDPKLREQMRPLEPHEAPHDPADHDQMILRRFSTNPLPIIETRRQGNVVHQLIDSQAAQRGRSVDIVTGVVRSPAFEHPLRDNEPYHRCSMIARTPSRHLVFDQYLHESLAAGSVPALDVFLIHPAASQAPRDRWYDRLPDRPVLQVLGRGLSRAAAEAASRHEELTRYMFERVGWDADDFVGFRCEAPYPIWCGEYSIAFDFRPPPRS